VGIYSIFTFFDILAPLKSEQNTINQNSRENSISKSNRAAGWITAAIILVLGTAIPVVDASFPKLYPQQSEQQIIAKLSATRWPHKLALAKNNSPILYRTITD